MANLDDSISTFWHLDIGTNLSKAKIIFPNIVVLQICLRPQRERHKEREKLVFLKWTIPGLFSLFFVLSTINKFIIIPMTGFELRTCVIRINRTTNWTTTHRDKESTTNARRKCFSTLTIISSACSYLSTSHLTDTPVSLIDSKFCVA